MNDWQLVAAWAQGEEQAFESLVRKYFPIVYSAAVRQLGDAHLAQDVAQSVFIIFARKASKLSSGVVLTGWFLRTTRFVVRDVLKQMNRRLQREQAAGALAALEQTAGWEADWANAVPLADEALLALSAGEQACVVARVIEERSFREIGERMRIGEDAAQKRVARGLEKMRRFLQRRGVKVGAVAIPAILGANLASAAGTALSGAAWTGVQAALQGKAAGTASLMLAEEFLKAIALRQLIRIGSFVALGVLLVGGGTFLALNSGNGAPAFRVSNTQLEPLGRAWAVVVQRAAFLMGFPQGRPPAGNPNRVAYDQANNFVLTETTRVSTELDAVLQTGRDRELLAEFLTIELRETLGLDARQQGEVFAQLRARLSQGPTFRDGLKALWDSKPTFGPALRNSLSAPQRQRFDQTYGTNAIGVLAFPGLVLWSGGVGLQVLIVAADVRSLLVAADRESAALPGSGDQRRPDEAPLQREAVCRILGQQGHWEVKHMYSMKTFLPMASNAEALWRFAAFFIAVLLGTVVAGAQPTTVVGWGWNNNGQATPPAGLTNIVAVSAGSAHSLALRANGTVVEWGFNNGPVPPGLNDIAAIACGSRHSLALRSNRTVVAWGDNPNGQTSVPAGLSNVIAVSGGGLHSLALKSDGTVVGWGTNRYGALNIPAGLSNVIAISAGGDHNIGAWSLALKSDGTLIGWGDNRANQTNPPTGLSNVVAISASHFLENVVLKSDGTVVSWGSLTRPVPAGLSNVVAIEAGDGNHLAVRADGSIVAWGDNFNGAINLPGAARNVSVFTMGYWHGLAVTRSAPPPWPRITAQPQSRRRLVGDSVTLSVTATSAVAVSYRWQFRGQNLAGQTNSALVLTNLQFSQAGDYAVVVSAGNLSVRSAPAFLAVSERPTAFPRAVEGLEDTELAITLEAADPSNLLLAGTVVALPLSGQLFQFEDGLRGAPIENVPAPFAGDTLLYVPNPDGNGRDEFQFIVANELGDSLPANVQINIRPVNDPPAFTKGPDLEIREDAGPQLVLNWATGVRAGPLNESGQSVNFLMSHGSYGLFSSPPALNAAGLLSYTPAPNANGSATVTVRLLDNGGSADGGQDLSGPQTFRITVHPVNDAPTAYAQTVVLDEDRVAKITLSAYDEEGDPLSYQFTPPTHGALSGIPPNLIYHPSPNYFGPDSFTFTASDGQTDSAVAVVRIQVAPVNDAPTAGAELFSPSRLTFVGSSNFILLAPDNSRGVIVCNATPSTDIENDPLEISWFLEREAVPFAVGLRVTNVFEVGMHTILLRVSDGNAEAEMPLRFEILALGEAVESLIARLDIAPLERNRKRPLIASLRVASASFDRSSFGAGANQLQAFQNKIRAQLTAVDPALAEELSRAAREILRAMGSP